MSNTSSQSTICVDGIPLPIVALNRAVIAGGVLLALAFDQPLITTALFALILPAALFGRRASLIFKIGSRLFASQIPRAELEDARVQRFNNCLAALMLGASQLSFGLGVISLGWFFAVAVAVAALVALGGFCVGCFFFYQFKLSKYRVLSWLNS
jgi:hypothetical protein